MIWSGVVGIETLWHCSHYIKLCRNVLPFLFHLMSVTTYCLKSSHRTQPTFILSYFHPILKRSWHRHLKTEPFFSWNCHTHFFLLCSFFSVYSRRYSQIMNDFSAGLKWAEKEGRVSVVCIFESHRPWCMSSQDEGHEQQAYIHIQCTLRRNLRQLPPGRARPVYEYW